MERTARTMQPRLAMSTSRWLAIFTAGLASLSWAQDLDAGLPPLADAGSAEATDAGAPFPPPAAPFISFDTSQTPWGPGRKSSGGVFRSAARELPEGPLRWSWNGFSVALGGQYFARAEVRDNADFATAAADHGVGVDHRARVSVRASARERVGVLLELQDVRGWGSEPNTVTTTPNTGLHQGFVDVRPTDWLDVRVGRQELSYGEDRLIGSLDWAQSARAFDGVFARVTFSPRFTLDGFGMLLKPPAWLTSPGGARFHNSGSFFSGLYGRARFDAFGVDLSALGLFEDPSTAAGPGKDHNRVTLTARAFATFGGLHGVAEGAFQTGKAGPREELVLAGAFAAKVTYTLKSVWGAPYVLGEFSGATGDGDAANGVEGTFHQLFPTGHLHLGFADYVAWQNVVAGRATVGLRPWGAHVWLDVHHFRAWDPRAAWSSASGAVFLAADPSRTDGHMGTELDLSFTIPVIPNLAFAGNVSVFVPGGMGASRGADPSTWGFLSLRAQL